MESESILKRRNTKCIQTSSGGIDLDILVNTIREAIRENITFEDVQKTKQQEWTEEAYYFKVDKENMSIKIIGEIIVMTLLQESKNMIDPMGKIKSITNIETVHRFTSAAAKKSCQSLSHRY